MVADVARKEFLLNLMTFRFAVAVTVCAILMAGSAAILVSEYGSRLERYGETVTRHRKEAQEIVLHSQVAGWADRPPAPLGFLALGVDVGPGSSIRVKHMEVPVGSSGGSRANPLLAIFADVDGARVVEVLVSLLVLLFAYDSVSGERERGTLPLTFANAVKRPQFLLGKYLGGMATVTVPILLGLLLATIIAVGSPWIELNGDLTLRVAAIAAASIAYASVFFLLGMAVSSRVRRSSTALILLFFAWICLVIVVPDTSAYLAGRWRPVTSSQVVRGRWMALHDAFWREMWELKEEGQTFGQMVREVAKAHPDAPQVSRWDLMIGRTVRSGELPYAFSLLYAPREIMEWYREGTLHGVRRQLDYAEQQWQVAQEHLREQEAQASVARRIAVVSPAWVYSQIAQMLAGTDVGIEQQFQAQARRYRQELVEYIEASGGFTTTAYFSRITEADLRPWHELAALCHAGGVEAIQELARPWTEELEPLPGMPEFRYKPETWSEALVRATPLIAWLIVLNALLFGLAHAGFQRQDLRQVVQ